jgi:hypothetical protein
MQHRIRPLVALTVSLFACSPAASSPEEIATTSSDGPDLAQCKQACQSWSDREYAHCLVDRDTTTCQAERITHNAQCGALTAEECDAALIEMYDDDGGGGEPSPAEGGDTSDTPNDDGGETSDSDPTDAGSDGGLLCDEGEAHCDGDGIIVCEDGLPIPYACDELCADAGYGAAVGCEPDGASSASCTCEPAAVCNSGESQCTGPDSGTDCVDGQWSDAISCDTFCQENGADLSLSCTQVGDQAQCDCRYACNPAVDTYTCSTDGEAMYWCYDGGWWEDEDCDDRCAAYGAIGTTGCQWMAGAGHYDCNCIWP